MHSILAKALLAAASLGLVGCMPVGPHRYRLSKPEVICNADSAQSVECRNSIFEHTAQYDLHFVEFDDQGLQYPEEFPPEGLIAAPGNIASEGCSKEAKDCLKDKAWAYQINSVMKELKRAAEKQPIVLVVFIHGWKHDARADDTNVQGFRQLLTETALIEENRLKFEKDAGGNPVNGARKVVGLYVGWRGESIDVPGLDNVTFWGRKTAANHVAQGSARELFARLRGFKCVQNAKSAPAGHRDCNQPPSRGDTVKVVLVGHSFGGLILYNAISASLIETMTKAFDSNEDDRRPYWRFADLAVLINPAFEATRYAPLQRIAATTEYSRYEPPLLVTVTSTTDNATGFWFKLGRSVNTAFESHADDDEKAANRETVGHHSLYLTHRLEIPASGRVECPGWVPVDHRMPAADLLRRLGRDLAIEYNNSQAFFKAGGARDQSGIFMMNKKVRWVRDFCGGVRLSVTGTDPNSPIWNVEAIGDPRLLPNHSDIGEPLFVGVFRQLYMDTIYLDRMVDGFPAKVPP